MADIARRADCSVGSFYARFPDKAALFHLLQAELVAEIGPETERLLSPGRSRGLSLGAVIQGYLGYVTQAYREHRELHHLLRELAMGPLGGRFRERAQKLQKQTADALEQLLIDRVEASDASTARQQARFLELMIRGVLAESSMADEREAEQLVETLTDACARYLGL